MSVRAAVWWLLAVLTVTECWAAIPSKRQTLPNIENGWPLSEEDAGEGDFIMQMPSCLAVSGVCTRRQTCQDEYVYEATDMCGEQEDIICCLTRSFFEKHVLQLKSCADTGSVCAFEEDCPEQDRHSNPLLCGDQLGVTCCKTLQENVTDPRPRRAQNVPLETPQKKSFDKKYFELKYKRRAHSVQSESCEDQGGICRQEEQCPVQDRIGTSDSCGGQPFTTCCQSTNLNRPSPFTTVSPSKRFADIKIQLQKEKRRAHSVQIESCEAQGGVCRQEEQCPIEDRMGTSDSCGDQSSIACCKISLSKRTPDKRFQQEIEKRRAHSVQIESCEAQGGNCIQNNQCPEESRLGTSDACGDNPLITCCRISYQSKEKRTPEQLQSSINKRDPNLGPRRPNHLPATLCESKGGTCQQESQCPEQDRYGSSDMCADEPSVACCRPSSTSTESVEERKKRRAHSVQLESCRAQAGMCTHVTNCPAENQLGFDMCGGLVNITCCHLSFLESAGVAAEEKDAANEPRNKDKRKEPIEIGSCKAQGGVCKKKIECPEEDYLVASDICGNPYELIYTCCRVSDTSVTKRRAHSVQIQSCRAQGGMCRQTDECIETHRLGSDACGGLPYITCCQKSNNSLSAEAEPRSIGFPNSSPRCLMRGGLCKRDVDCFPEDRYEGSHLCGKQAGVSCCKRLPPRVGECSARGGECVPESICQNGPRDSSGQCSGGDVCCVWTRMWNPDDEE